MSEANDPLEDMISHASGMIAAGKGKIKIREAMRMTACQVETMSLYQKIRRKSMKMVVVDKRSIELAAGPLPQVHMGSGNTVQCPNLPIIGYT